MALRRLAHCFLAAAISFGGVAAVTASPASAAPLLTAAKGRTRAPDALADQAQLAFVLLGTSSGYGAALDSIATEVAHRAEVDPARLSAAWRAADVAHQRALLAALSQLGVPYRHNASKEGVAFDCSGLTSFAWGRAGVTLARQSRAQITAAEARTASTVMAGDLVYYPGHVMMYLGVDDAIVHAPEPGRNVQIDNVTQRRQRSIRFGDPAA